jgi:lysophospholipase L1-like esterase
MHKAFKGAVVTVALAAVLVASGYAASASPIRGMAPRMAAVAPLRIVTLGDSLTVGPISYRTELGRLLDLASVSYTFIIAANAGWTCADWAPVAQQTAVNTQPDLVIVNCGSNDGKFPSLYASGVIDNNLRSIYTGLMNGWPTTKVLPSYVQYSAERTGWAAGQGYVNDGVWRQTNIYNNYGPRLIVPAAILGNIPEIYTDAGGGHPTEAGYVAMARYFYNALRASYGWPDVAPTPCGMNGRRPGDPMPSYVPCTVLAA